MAPESEQASSLHEGAQVEKGSFHPRQAAPALAADVVPVEGAWAVRGPRILYRPGLGLLRDFKLQWQVRDGLLWVIRVHDQRGQVGALLQPSTCEEQS